MKTGNELKALYFSISVFLGILILSLSYFRVFEDLEDSTFDFRYSLRPAQPFSKDIVIIEIGDDTMEKLGKWPLPRNYHALLVKALQKAGAKAIVFDIFFSEEKEGDADLAEAVKDAGNVYMPYIFDLDRTGKYRDRVGAIGYAATLIEPLNDAAKGTGFINVEPDNDGKVRRIPPVMYYDGKFYPHMTVLVALEQLGYDLASLKVTPGKKLEVGKDLIIPLDERSSMIVNYPGRWQESFRHYSYVDVIQSYLAGITGQQPTIDLNDLKGTICFIGLTATASPDAHPSPMEPLYHGIGVHTSVYNSILSKSFLRRLDRWANVLLLAVFALLTLLVTSISRKRFSILSIVAIMFFYFCMAMVLFWPFGIWIDVFYPIVAMGVIYVILTFKKYVTETQKREVLEKELNIAKDIQRSFLPSIIPDIGGIQLNAKMFTAKQVGGDLYDIFELDGNRLGMMIGDVSGKGVPAALFMAKVVSVFKSFALHVSPAAAINDVNERLVKESNTNLFVTMTYAIFDTASRKVTFAMGGHLPTLMVSPDGSVKMLDTKEGAPLGLISGDFSEHETSYEPGSLFVFYTDGVTEAMNTKEQMFGQDRLVKVVTRFKDRSPAEIVDAVHKAVAAFEGKDRQHDDITIIAVRA